MQTLFTDDRIEITIKLFYPPTKKIERTLVVDNKLFVLVTIPALRVPVLEHLIEVKVFFQLIELVFRRFVENVPEPVVDVFA